MAIRYFGLVLGILVLSACGDTQPDTRAVPSAAPASDNVMEVGGYEVHVNALSTDQLPPAITQSYGIVRSQNRALLNVAVIKKSTSETVATSVEAKAVNLTGQLKTINMRKIEERDESAGSIATYYIGEVAVANRETLTFDVTVSLPDEDEPVSMRFKRQFFSD